MRNLGTLKDLSKANQNDNIVSHESFSKICQKTLGSRVSEKQKMC